MTERRAGVEHDHRDQRPGEIGMDQGEDCSTGALCFQRRQDGQMRPRNDAIKHGRDVQHRG